MNTSVVSRVHRIELPINNLPCDARPSINTMKLPHLKFILAALTIVSVPSVSATTVMKPTDWFKIQGYPKLDKSDLSAPVVGGDGVDAADDVGVSVNFAGFKLAKADDSLEISGTVQLIAGVASFDQFRFGLFDRNGKSDTTGWLGYSVSAGSGGGAGLLRELRKPNSALPINIGGADRLQEVKTNDVFSALSSSRYDFSIKYTRQANNSLTIEWSIIKQLGGYKIGGKFNDTTPQTFTFDRAAFLFGGGLNIDRVNFSNVKFTAEQ